MDEVKVIQNKIGENIGMNNDLNQKNDSLYQDLDNMEKTEQ